MVIRFADKNEYPAVLGFLEACNYSGGICEGDRVVIAFDERIIGAVRICSENGETVLRGMQVEPAWRRKSIGLLILKFLAHHLNMDGCYCLPYKHLKGFYASIGFEEVSEDKAPEFLAQRLNSYLNRGLQVMIMQIAV